MGGFLGFLGAFVYGVSEGRSVRPYRRYACFSCMHDGFFPMRDIPQQCDEAGCTGTRQRWWEVVKCPGCDKDLFYLPGDELDEACEAENGIHDPEPVSTGDPPKCR